ncbi:MAG: hypothetical protein ACMXYB_03410 [Candidatus Woesearchaeota archaeon]
MVVLELEEGKKYRVLNKTGVGSDVFQNYEGKYFTPSGDFIGKFETLYGMPFTKISRYPYMRKDMSSNLKILTPPLDNNIEYVGIRPIPKSDIFLTFDFKRTDIRNLDDLRAGIEEILLAHHEDWQDKRRRQGRDENEKFQRKISSYIVKLSI